MASVHIPCRTEHKGIRRFGYTTPYIIDSGDRYLEGVNHYIYDRIRGKINPGDLSRPKSMLRRLSTTTARAIVSAICDGTNFLESEISHPSLGSLNWLDARAWMFNELYEEAMTKGFWTQSFWKQGIAEPLAYNHTIKVRVAENMRCGSWLELNGYIKNFNDESDAGDVPRHLMEANRSLATVKANLAPQSACQIGKRQNPGHGIPPSLEEILAFIQALPTETSKLVAILLYDTGMRAEELVENTKIPSSWAGAPRKTNESIGFLPDVDAFWADTPSLAECKWKIVGKGNKIRFVRASPRTLQAMWRYWATTRKKLIQRCRSSTDKTTDTLFLNCRGKPHSYHNQFSAMRSTNILLGREYRITQHILRHAHACTYMETAICAEMRARNIDINNASYEDFMRIGEGVQLLLMNDLGHELLATTEKYLRMLAHGKIGLRYQMAFNDRLDELGDFNDFSEAE